MDGESIKGAFYEPELQKVWKPDKDELFVLEKVLRMRRRKDRTVDYFVKWAGYPNKFNQWITDLVRRGDDNV